MEGKSLGIFVKMCTGHRFICTQFTVYVSMFIHIAILWATALLKIKSPAVCFGFFVRWQKRKHLPILCSGVSIALSLYTQTYIYMYTSGVSSFALIFILLICCVICPIFFQLLHRSQLSTNEKYIRRELFRFIPFYIVFPAPFLSFSSSWPAAALCLFFSPLQSLSSCLSPPASPSILSFMLSLFFLAFLIFMLLKQNSRFAKSPEDLVATMDHLNEFSLSPETKAQLCRNLFDS